MSATIPAHYTCLSCGDVLPPHRGGHCQACVEWQDDTPIGPEPFPGDEDPPGGNDVPDKLALPNPDDDSPPIGPDPERCRFCGGSHHIQQCGAIQARLGNPGRAINRQWTCDTRRFANILRSLDPSVWYLLAAPCAQYRGMTTAEVLDRWERLARGVELPASAREAA